MTRILLADHDPAAQSALTQILRGSGFEVDAAADGHLALRSVSEDTYDLVIADLELPRLEGLQFLREMHLVDPDLPVIVISSFSTTETAVAAVKEGAFQHLSKPVVDEEVRTVVRKAIEDRRLKLELRRVRAELDRRSPLDLMVGNDPRMQRIFHTIAAVAATRSTVLITGESGTGKTMLARLIHQASTRRKGPFVEVNCGALTDTLLESELFGHVRGAFTGAVRDRAGKFEQAQNGTIFLDEVSTASQALQVKLLRVLQDRQVERVGDGNTLHVDVRVVLATNQDLTLAVQQGNFRQDLFYRINVVNISVPPLRERPEDVMALASHFLGLFAEEHGRPIREFTPEAVAALCSHGWPGNVRELRNAVERAVVLSSGPMVTAEHLPLPAPAGSAGHSRHTGGGVQAAAEPPAPVAADASLPLKLALEAPERQIIEGALARNGGNRQKTAAMLQINRTTLFNKMKKYGLLGPRRDQP
jgi:two-component system response regulator AtoC